MLNNSNHNSSCDFAEQIVSYIYDEASVKEKIEFVAHLENCSGCNDELTAFGFVRSSIQEWRNEEIFALEMPVLEIPTSQTVQIEAKSNGSTESESWLAGLRTIFSLSQIWTFGAGAFAAVLFCIIVTILVLNFSKDKEIAGNSNLNLKKELSNANNIAEPVSPAIATKPQNREVVPPEVRPEQVKFNSQKDASIKSSENSKGSLKNKTFTKKPNNTMAGNTTQNKPGKTNKIEKQENLKLTDLGEEEDNSLRLADLFAEIGTE